MQQPLEENTFWEIGLRIIRQLDEGSSVGIKRFRGHFDNTVYTFTIIEWNLSAWFAKPLYLHCAILFLKVYATESVHHEKTFRQWTKAYINILAYEWNAEGYMTYGVTTLVSIDGIEFPIQEMVEKNLFSHNLGLM